jgi:hypothetical protein
MSANGPERQFAAVQHDVGNGGLSGRSADAAGPAPPQGPKGEAAPRYRHEGRRNVDWIVIAPTVAYVLLVAFALWVGLAQ